MTAGREYPVILSGLCALLSWFTVMSWGDMVEAPSRFVGPTFTGAVLVAVTGALLRTVRSPWWAALAAQLAVLTSWLHHRLGTGGALDGWVPTWQGLRFVAEQIREGAEQVNTYAAPIDVRQAQAPVYLLATALVVVLAVDLIAGGLRRAPLAGLPVLVALTVPISVLDSSLPLLPLAGVAASYLALIAYARVEEVLGWGQGSENEARNHRRSTLVGAGPAVGIGVLTTLAALTLPVFVPLGPGFLGRGDGGGTGEDGGSITLRNPLVDLRRDLERNENIPLLQATTQAADPTYLRMTVLDRFDGSSWVPGPRSFPARNRASGPLPNPDGVTPQSPGTETGWQLRTTPDFLTSWLPVPYPTRAISTDRGDWRYDSTTLDIANTDDRVPGGVTYSAVGFAPSIDATRLDAAGVAPPALRTPMTRVPNLDERVTTIARNVTAGAQTDYQRAVRLQRWFRSTGGFAYSLDPAPGSGMSQLVRFLTTDKIGYCEQYAASMAVMARALGMPARVVVGFLKPEELAPGTYRYTSSDLHAWPEIYFSGSGWVRFEPTPGARTGAPPDWTLADVPAPAPVIPTPSPTQAAPTTPSTPQPQTEATATDTSSARPVVLGVLVAGALAALVALPWLVRRSQRSRRLAARDDGREEMENLWRELRASAVDLRTVWPEGRSVRAIARGLITTTSPTSADIAMLEAFVDLVEQARYRRTFELGSQDRATARAAVQRWSTLLALASSRRAARRARWFPRSILVRTCDVRPPAADDRAQDLAGVG